MKKSHCQDCYNDVYNHGLGGAKECWMFEKAKVIWRKQVHIDQIPPWKQKSKRFPNCYSKQRFVYVRPDRER